MKRRRFDLALSDIMVAAFVVVDLGWYYERGP